MHTLVDQLRLFVMANASRMRYYEGGSRHLELPQFTLYPLDYLAAAERELTAAVEASTEKARVMSGNACVHQLKHAIECAADVFLAAYGLYEFATDQGLMLAAKLNFLDAIGVAPTRSLRRLNTIRNRIEHHHAVAPTAELELYFDVASTYVALLQTATALAAEEEATFVIRDEDGEETGGGVHFEYRHELPEVIFGWSDSSWPSSGSAFNFAVGPSEREDFAVAFRIMLLLLQLEHIVSGDYLARVLGEIPGA